MTDLTLQEPLPPPPAEPAAPIGARLPPGQWVRKNLFSSRLNTVLTVVFSVLLAWAAFRALRFVFVTADWLILRRNIATFMVGRFPRDELWRPWTAIYVLAFLIGVVGGVAARLAIEVAEARGEPPRPSHRGARWVAVVQRFWPLGLLAVVVLVLSHGVLPIGLVAGAMATIVVARLVVSIIPRSLFRWTWVVVVVGLVAALEVITGFGGVGWDRWGGLLLTAFVSVGGIAAAFPLGLLLALGRRSNLPAIRGVSIAYIEFFRGVPLVALIFMGVFVIGFFFPTGFDVPSRLMRAVIAIVLFESAYVAEVVRGGLQAVPRGQYEAAQALGLSPWKVTRLIVLPQALRAVIPAMVGQFISLYKDTSLLTVVGFFELLRVAQVVTQQSDFLGQGLHAETLTFAAFVYWVGSYTMSRESQRLERRLGVGVR